MPHTQWTLPPARPIVDRRPSAAQIVGLLLAGLIVGIAGALVGVNYADSHRQPDVFNESGPWVPVMPDLAGVPETTLHMNMEFSQLTTGCGEWDIAYVQDGANITFSKLPPAPARCSPDAAEAHTWFVSQLANTRTFAPTDFWSTPNPTVTFNGADGMPLVAIAPESASTETSG